MKYLKTDAEIMQALFIDKHDVDEYITEEETKTLTLIDGNICYLNGKRTYIDHTCKYAIHVEPKWYEGLSPEKPMLARGKETGKAYEVIGDDHGIAIIKNSLADPILDKLTPLTREQIQVFMDNAPE